MARMMDTLILDNLSPFTFTKITTTHRPQRISAGNLANGSLLAATTATQSNLKKATSTANVSQGTLPGMASSTIRVNLQKKIPTQG